MAKLFGELLSDVRSEGLEKLTIQEMGSMLSAHSRAWKHRTIGSLTACGITLAATWATRLCTKKNTSARRLINAIGLKLVAGATVYFGDRSYNRSLDSFLDKIIGQEGSLLQEKLANIIIRKYPDDTRGIQLLKHFVLEKIYRDSSCDLRLRYRNCSGDDCILGQRKREVYDRRMPQQASKTIKLGLKDIVEDPLYNLLGESETTSWKETQQFNTWYASSLRVLDFDDLVDHDFINLL